MNKITAPVFFALILFGSMAFQPKPELKEWMGMADLSGKLPEIKWQDTLIDLGTIKEGQPVKGVFKLTNSGNEPVLISQVERWSSSLMVGYTKKPILRGASGEVVVELHSSGKSGPYVYKFGVYSNFGRHHLTIRYHVSKANDTLPEVEWDRQEYNFGKIAQGEKPEAVFTLTNHGKEPLEIENVIGSCGCMVSNWTRTSVPQGKTGQVNVKFNSKGKHGKQEKSVSVYTSKGLFTLYLYAWVDEN